MVEHIDIDDLEVLTDEGYKSFSGIKRSVRREIYTITFEGGGTLRTTPEHQVMVGDKFVFVRDLRIGDCVSDNMVSNITYNCDIGEAVYDLLNVEDTHHYITNGVTSHNCAFVENWDEFFASVFPTISSGETTKILFTSTPNGLNHYYKTCTGAMEGTNGYAYVEVPWQKVPGRDKKWYEETIAAMDFDYEKFAQEFECQWLGSSGTLISGATLKTLIPRHAIQQKDGLNLYKEKIGNHQYVIVCDVSRGKGLDYSAFQIIDVTTMPYEQVCTYRNNTTTPLDYAGVIYQMSKLYNNAMILVEINDVGAQVADALYMDYECENLIYTENAGSRGKRISTGFSRGQTKTGGAERGIRTTKTVKSIGCSMLKLLIEQQQLIINDHQTINELSRFSRRGSSYEAEPGSNDDLVMALVLFAWMTDQQYFKDLTDINTLKVLRDKTDEELENDLVPFGFIDTGHDENDMVVDLTETPSKEFRFF